MVVGCRPSVVDVLERVGGKYAPDSASFSGFKASTLGDSTGDGSSSCNEFFRSAAAMSEACLNELSAYQHYMGYAGDGAGLWNYMHWRRSRLSIAEIQATRSNQHRTSSPYYLLSVSV